MNTKAKKIEVLSPDGISIENNDGYDTLEQANEALEKWIQRFKNQGYYSTVENGQRIQIPFDEIKERCVILN
jgi:hypothetical protein